MFNVYEKLRTAAKVDVFSKIRLEALEETFDYFQVQHNKNTVAKSILRLELLTPQNRKPNGADVRAKMLFKMFEYYRRKVKKARNV